MRNPAETTSASAPKLPMRLSRMISNLRSGVRPPPKPSAVSARPSSCSPPVSRIAAATVQTAATAAGSPRLRAAQNTAAASAPSTAPTTG
jgi:hypothetical protein